MQFIKIAVITLLVGGTIYASVATYRKVGVQTVESPEGISLRQESVRNQRPGRFLYYNRTHSHRGGGLSRGK